MENFNPGEYHNTPEKEIARKPEYLKVERGTLMHSGGFDDFFKGNINISDVQGLHFGVCSNENPEDNTSIRMYVHKRHLPGSSRRQCTAVYKDDYIKRVLLYYDKNPSESTGLRKDCKYGLKPLDNAGQEEIKKNQCAWDEGPMTDASQIFNPSEIKAIICYSMKKAQELIKSMELYPEDTSHISVLVERVSEDALPAIKEILKEIISNYLNITIAEDMKAQEDIAKASENVKNLLQMAYSYLEKNEPLPEIIEKNKKSQLSKEKLVEQSIDWIIDRLERYGYAEAVDNIDRDYRVQQHLLRGIILERGEVPMSNKKIERDNRKYSAEVELPNIRDKYIKLIECADNITVDDVLNQIKSDRVIPSNVKFKLPEYCSKLLYDKEKEIKLKNSDSVLYVYVKYE